MPSVLISDDRADVKSALASQPKFTDPQVKALSNWVFWLVTTLFSYISFFMGNNADRHETLRFHVQDLEDKFQELQDTPPIPMTTPHTTPQQPPAPSKHLRCCHCSVLGHDTKDCCTKDPIAIKKWVTNNQKARKQTGDPLLGGIQLPRVPPQYSPFYGPCGATNIFGDPLFIYSQPSPQAFTSLVVDAKELRRRKMQSRRDRRRTNGVASSTA